MIFKTARGRAAPVGREVMEARSRRVSSTHAWIGRRPTRSEMSSSGEVGVWVGTTSSGGCGFGGRGFETRGCFLSWLPSSRLSGCCRFRLGLLRPSLLPGDGHLRLRWRLRDRLRRGINIWGWSGGGLENTPPRTTWFQPSPRSICSVEGPARWAFGAAGWPVAALLRTHSVAYFARAAFASFHLIQPRYFAVWLPPQPQRWCCCRGVKHPPERLESPHAMHRGAYSQFRFVWPKRWQRLHFNGPFGATYVSTDTRRPQSSVIDRTLDTSGPRATDTIKLGWEGDPWLGPGRDGRSAAAWLPRHECPGTRAPPGRRSQAHPCPGFSPEAAYSSPPGAWRCGNSHPPPIEGLQCADHGSETFGGWRENHKLLSL